MDCRSARYVTPAKAALRSALQAGSCADALIELCGRIWLELERLAHLNARSSHPESSSLDLGAETLRLELLLILDACESAAWICMLDADVRRRLFAMSRDVLAIIAVGPNELTLGVIERAQDRVFDEATDSRAERNVFPIVELGSTARTTLSKSVPGVPSTPCQRTVHGPEAADHRQKNTAQ